MSPTFSKIEPSNYPDVAWKMLLTDRKDGHHGSYVSVNHNDSVERHANAVVAQLVERRIPTPEAECSIHSHRAKSSECYSNDSSSFPPVQCDRLLLKQTT